MKEYKFYGEDAASGQVTVYLALCNGVFYGRDR